MNLKAWNEQKKLRLIDCVIMKDVELRAAMNHSHNTWGLLPMPVQWSCIQWREASVRKRKTWWRSKSEPLQEKHVCLTATSKQETFDTLAALGLENWSQIVGGRELEAIKKESAHVNSIIEAITQNRDCISKVVSVLAGSAWRGMKFKWKQEHSLAELLRIGSNRQNCWETLWARAR